MRRQKPIKAPHVMTTEQAQEMADRNADTIKEIILLQVRVKEDGARAQLLFWCAG